jgi:hypothetical protein
MARERTQAMTAALAAVISGATMEAAAQANGVTRRGLYNAMVQDGIPRPRRGRPATGKKPPKRNDLTRRKNRLQQAEHRGSRRSYKTDAENLCLLLLWEAGELSEGQVARALNTDRLTVRLIREGAMAEAMKFAEVMLPPNGAGNRLARQGQSELTGLLGPGSEANL